MRPTHCNRDPTSRQREGITEKSLPDTFIPQALGHRPTKEKEDLFTEGQQLRPIQDGLIQETIAGKDP
jgi:hypothetical protein